MNTPTCVGIIMDGNRRWAKARGLSSAEGHLAGYETLKKTVKWAKELGISHIAVFAFSTENWNRSETEVSFLVNLLSRMIDEEGERFVAEKVRVVFAGNLSLFGEALVTKMKELEEKTAQFSTLSLTVCVSYGGRDEIIHAAQEAAKKAAAEGRELTEADFTGALYTKNMPDPDIIIRTSGEERLSGFLPWQGVYSELFFTETLWPDFSKEELQSIVAAYSERQRRHGI